MFTLERASKIFPNTQSADVVPAITARFKLLNAEDQLALIWYAYLEMGRTITVAAPAAARMQFAEGVLNQIKAMSFDEQSQVMCDLGQPLRHTHRPRLLDLVGEYQAGILVSAG